MDPSGVSCVGMLLKISMISHRASCPLQIIAFANILPCMIPKWEFHLGTRCKGDALLSATFVRTRLMQLIEAGHFMLSRSLLTKDYQSCSRCGVQNTKKSTWRKHALFCTDSKLTTGRILSSSNTNETFKQYRKEYLEKKVGSWRQ